VASGERIYSRGRGEVIGTGNGARRTMSVAVGRKRFAVILTATLVVLVGFWLAAPAQASDEPSTPTEGSAEAEAPAASEGECDPATCVDDQGGSDSETDTSGGTPTTEPPSQPPSPQPDPAGSGDPVGEPPVDTPPAPDEPAASPPDAGALPTDSVPVEVLPETVPPEGAGTPPEEVTPPVTEEPLPTASAPGGLDPIVVVGPGPALDFASYLEMLDSQGSGSSTSPTDPFVPAHGRAAEPATSGHASESSGRPAVPKAAPRRLGPLSPIGPSSPSPAPGGATAVSSSGSGGGFSQIFLAALVAALSVGVAHRFTRRLIPLVAVWRPAAPVSPLERPG
jgi:hypothetical protein